MQVVFTRWKTVRTGLRNNEQIPHTIEGPRHRACSMSALLPSPIPSCCSSPTFSPFVQIPAAQPPSQQLCKFHGEHTGNQRRKTGGAPGAGLAAQGAPAGCSRGADPRAASARQDWLAEHSHSQALQRGADCPVRPVPRGSA